MTTLPTSRRRRRAALGAPPRGPHRPRPTTTRDAPARPASVPVARRAHVVATPDALDRLAARVATLPHGAKVAAALATVYLVWGSTFLSTAVVVQQLPPMLMLAARFLLAGGLLLAFGVARARRRPGWAWPRWRQWRDATVTGCVLLVGGTGMISLAQVRLSSGLAALLTATVPLWLAVLARVRFGDVLSGRAGLGLLVGLAGVAVLVDPGGGQVGAMLLVLTGAALWAAGTLRSRVADVPQAPLVAAGMEMLGAGVGFVVVGLLRAEHTGLDLAAVDPGTWLAYAYLVTAGSIVAFTAYRWLMDHVSTAVIGSHGYVNPTVAVVLGWALVGEEVTLRTLVGGLVVLVAVVLLVTGRPEQPVPAQATSGGDVFAGRSRWRRVAGRVGRAPVQVARTTGRLAVRTTAQTRPSVRRAAARDRARGCHPAGGTPAAGA